MIFKFKGLLSQIKKPQKFKQVVSSNIHTNKLKLNKSQNLNLQGKN